MMFKWFCNCKNSADVKRRYYELCKEFHPDNGGDADTMKVINAEFSEAFEYFKNHADFTETEFNKNVSRETPENLKKILSELSKFDNIEIEICGSWIWITGMTFVIKEELKNLGCRWSKGKHRWYYTESDKCFYRGSKSMKQIRQIYGSQIYAKEERLYLN